MNYTVIYPKSRVIRTLYKDRPIVTAEGFDWESDGAEEVFYEVSLNLAAVEDMARRAAGNVGQVSKAGPLWCAFSTASASREHRCSSINDAS